jgi:hypothetical protein
MMVWLKLWQHAIRHVVVHASMFDASPSSSFAARLGGGPPILTEDAFAIVPADLSSRRTLPTRREVPQGHLRRRCHLR